jgi:hypothetical protein
MCRILFGRRKATDDPSERARAWGEIVGEAKPGSLVRAKPHPTRCSPYLRRSYPRHPVSLPSPYTLLPAQLKPNVG